MWGHGLFARGASGRFKRGTWSLSRPRRRMQAGAMHDEARRTTTHAVTVPGADVPLARRGVTAVRSDGGLVRIRPVSRLDREALQRLHRRASERSNYLRFFTLDRNAASA